MTTKHTHKKASVKDWHRADIKAALEKAGWSYASLSIRHGFDRRMAQQATYRPYPRAERLIADAIGIHPSEIWPTRYDADGNPLKKLLGRPAAYSIRFKNNSSKHNRNVKRGMKQ